MKDEMEPKATLTDTVTGYIVDVTFDCLKSTDFYWTEGNMSCDCNRASYFPYISETERMCSPAHTPQRFTLTVTPNFPWAEPTEEEI